MKRLLIPVYFLLTLAYAQPREAADPIPDRFADGWKKSQAVMRFAQKDLYGYIDGGAELFLEFGFAELAVQRYQCRDNEMSLDLYRMESPDAALAVYLAKKGQEQPVAEVACRHTGGDYQITALRGRYFIQINNNNGKIENRPAMLALFKAVVNSIPPETPSDWFSRLPANAIAGSEMLVRGPFSVQSIFTFGEGDMLQLDGKQFGWSVDYTGTDGRRQTWLEVNYADSLQSSQVFRYLTDHLDPYLQKVTENGNRLLFKDYNNQYGKIERSGQTLQIRLHLSQPL
jgi:hypothetical protein